jgi:putative oxidoreductase
VLQILMAVFVLVAAAGPKLPGEATAVEMFALIGARQCFRYLVGALELAGALDLG